MTDIPYRTALIVGAGPGISASLARALSAAGLGIGLAARGVEKLAPLAAEIGAKTFRDRSGRRVSKKPKRWRTLSRAQSPVGLRTIVNGAQRIRLGGA